MSMIREIADRGLDRRFRLLYGSREADDIIFHAELDQLAGAHPNIHVHHVIGDLLTADTITELVGDLDGRMVYVCGPQVFYPFALEQLTALGQPRRRIRFEANGAPADPTAEPDWPTGVDAEGEVTITIGGSSFRTPATDHCWTHWRTTAFARRWPADPASAACAGCGCARAGYTPPRRPSCACPIPVPVTPTPASPTRSAMWNSSSEASEAPANPQYFCPPSSDTFPPASQLSLRGGHLHQHSTGGIRAGGHPGGRHPHGRFGSAQVNGFPPPATAVPSPIRVTAELCSPLPPPGSPVQPDGAPRCLR